MSDIREEELFLQYRQEYLKIETELEKLERRNRRFEEEKSEYRDFCQKEQRVFEQERDEIENDELFRLEKYFREFQFERDMELTRQAEELYEEKKRIMQKERNAEELYQNALTEIRRKSL